MQYLGMESCPVFVAAVYKAAWPPSEVMLHANILGSSLPSTACKQRAANEARGVWAYEQLRSSSCVQLLAASKLGRGFGKDALASLEETW